MLYAGLDYHLRTSSPCILNEDGKVVKQQTIRGRMDDVAAELAKVDQPLEVVFEATGGYGPLHERLSRWPGRAGRPATSGAPTARTRGPAATPEAADEGRWN